MALEGVWGILDWLRRPTDELGVAGSWLIAPEAGVSYAGEVYSGTGVTRRNSTLVSVPFVRVEYYDGGLQVVEHLARLVAAYWSSVRQCNNPACTLALYKKLAGKEMSPKAIKKLEAARKDAEK